MEEKLDTIGKRIKALRKIRNLKRKDISNSLNISEGNLYSMENDKTNPSANALIKLSKFFEVTTDWILFGDQKKEKNESNRPSRLGFINNTGINLEIPDMEIAMFFAKIIEEWKNGDERIKVWVIVQLEKAFPEIAKKVKRGAR